LTSSTSEDNVVPIDCIPLDRLLKGGIPINRISLIYGEAATGKSTLAIQCAVNTAKRGYRTIFVDGDNDFSPIRLAQIADYELERVSPLIVLITPKTFQEQGTVIDHLERYINQRVNLIVIDSVTSLYRTKLSFIEDAFTINRELNRQIASLAQLTKKLRIATLITSQVRSIPDDDHIKVEPVASRVLRFWSDVIISLERIGDKGIIRSLVEKHPKMKEANSCYITIKKNGISR
jgi:DNA repair protein RadB